MNYRTLGKTNFKISEISLGTWQVGGKWGSGYNQTNAEKILHAAIDGGINFIDTADVYEAGESEKSVGKVVRSRSEEIYVATKCGRQIHPHVFENFSTAKLRQFVDDSLQRTGLEKLDLIQLHCPPYEVYYQPEYFELFEELKREGKIEHMGVSVHTVEEALKAIEFENVSTVQIIFNLFRQRPSELFFKEAVRRNVGIIVRVPLASGLLTGKFNKQTKFKEGDHRQFKHDKNAFERGETFGGIPFEAGIEAVEVLKEIFPGQQNLALIALQWILQFPEVSCVIPGASSQEQIRSNLSVNEMPSISTEKFEAMNLVYEKYIKTYVHQHF